MKARSKRKHRFYRYMNPKYLKEEIHCCGYHFTWSGYLRYLLLIYAGIGGCAYFFGLRPVFILVVMVCCSLFVGHAFVITYKSRYEQKKFADVTNYMEQLLYSFKRRSKILSSLEDTLALFPEGEMHDDIRAAVSHIRSAETSGNIYEEAFEIIEKDYECRRLNAVHRFLMKVERTGGEFESSADILLDDRKMWVDRIYELERDKKNVKVKVTLGIGLSFLICGMAVKILPQKFGITGHPISQAVTTAVILLNLLIWYTAHKKLSGSLIRSDEEKEPKEIQRRYNTVMKEELGARKRRFLTMALLLTPAVLLLVLKGSTVSVFVAVAFLILLATQPGRRYKAAFKATQREIEKSFPDWLLNMALLLQTENVHISLEKSLEDAPIVLREEIALLNRRIERAPDQIEPYILFMEPFHIPEITSAMKMLYSMAEYGSGDVTRQIQGLVQRNFSLMDKSQRLRSEDFLSGMGALVLLPMITGTVKMLTDMALLVIGLLSVIQTVNI